jgi:hypothetical protein
MSEIDFRIVEGNDRDVSFLLSDETDGVDVPKDLTGKTVEVFLKDRPSELDGTPEYSTATSGVVINAPSTAGKITVSFAAAQMTGPKHYHIDVVAGGKRTTYVWGTIGLDNV